MNLSETTSFLNFLGVVVVLYMWHVFDMLSQTYCEENLRRMRVLCLCNISNKDWHENCKKKSAALASGYRKRLNKPREER